MKFIDKTEIYKVSENSSIFINLNHYIINKIKEFKMAVPKKKVSRSRRGNRRSHDALSFQTIECPNCGAEKIATSSLSKLWFLQ